jgi:hypothetical protein
MVFVDGDDDDDDNILRSAPCLHDLRNPDDLAKTARPCPLSILLPQRALYFRFDHAPDPDFAVFSACSNSDVTAFTVFTAYLECVLSGVLIL